MRLAEKAVPAAARGALALPASAGGRPSRVVLGVSEPPPEKALWVWLDIVPPPAGAPLVRAALRGPDPLPPPRVSLAPAAEAREGGCPGWEGVGSPRASLLPGPTGAAPGLATSVWPSMPQAAGPPCVPGSPSNQEKLSTPGRTQQLAADAGARHPPACPWHRDQRISLRRPGTPRAAGGAMSHFLSFVELINLAIGTPELGNVNFNALHLFLLSLVEHLQLQNVRKEVTADELEFIKPPPSAAASMAASSETVHVSHQSSSIFHQMHERITAIEQQLRFLNDTPDTAELLARSQGIGQPTQDMWQMMQLKKKIELNEEGMTKAMNTLQDLLNSICSLKIATDGFHQELGQLKHNVAQINGEEMKERLLCLDEQARMMEDMKEQLDLVKERVMSADASDVVCWSALCETLTSKSSKEEGEEEEEEGAREKTSRDILAVLGQLPEKHAALLKQVAELEAQLKYPGGPGASTFEISPELRSLLERMEKLQTQSKQGKESLQGTLEQMEKLKEQYEKLQMGVEKLARNASDIQVMRNMLEQLDVKKADKALIEEEMNVKADKSALEAMVNHGELQVATSQLSEMMQDLLQKMSLQDKDWQKALEKLFIDMDCKLDRMALDPVSRQLEEVWRFIKKYLSEGPRFDADSAAGFKKQLFERVKCISCDRPVTMMTGPHMITVRRATLRPRPASANGYEYLSHQQKRDQDPNEMSGNLPLQTCWQCQAHHQACTLKRLTRSHDFTTLYPYGDPAAITYDNTEVDILGVNGVLYKGRVSSQAADRAFALQKEFAALKFPRPPTGVRMERVRSAFADVSAVPYPPSALRRVGSAIANSNRQPQQLSCDPVDRTVISATFSQSHVQNGKDIPGL